jgi:hypothetical protein
MKRCVKLLVKNDCQMKFNEIGKQMNPKISVSFVWSILKKEGYYQRKVRKIVYLTPQNKKQKYEWVKKFQSWDKKDWERVIWSNKVYVMLGDWKGSVYVTKKADEKFYEDHVVLKFKQFNL